MAARSISRLWLRAPEYEPVVERVHVPLAGLPEGLRGLTIAHLSDFHSGRHVSAQYVRQVAQQTMALHPELVALTGDFVDRNVKYSKGCAEALSLLHAPLGVHVVLGNHDYWTNATVIESDLRRAGLAPMHNQSRRVERGGAAFYVVGVDDVRRRKANLELALRDVPPGAPKLLLVHEPDFADYVPGDHHLLQLSGHSHGGQICIPPLGALLLPSWGRKYAAGLYRMRTGMWLYTTRGVGLAMPPVRINCPPEITLLTLESDG
jgi:predicted MPP superfamily phosphohydrolase